ncbi:MAG TPA: AAA domain-containing protein [Polyangiales bacterium]|nr:AAA domain-containing protein [Polyangiales bacterium]
MLPDLDTDEQSSSVFPMVAARTRVLKIFEYLKALHALRSPTERQIAKQRWSMWLGELPDHPCVRVMDVSGRRDAEDAFQSPEVLLAVRRPPITPCPLPPESLREWLEAGWIEPHKEVNVRASINRVDAHKQSFIETFNDDLARPPALKAWLLRRNAWAVNEMPARAAMHCFERLYQLHGLLEREGETHELVVGNGVLSWKLESGSIHHPVLLQSVQLVFDPRVPEFYIQETDSAPELFTALFAGVSSVEGRQLAASREELKSGGYHPLAEVEARAFLRSFAARLAVDGELVDFKPDKETRHPLIGLAPVLFLRSRAQGFAAAIDQVLDRLYTSATIPPALLRIVGVEPDAEKLDTDAAISGTPEPAIPHDSLLFSKPANEEQARIAASLEQQSCVLVQGPPGTGKSHTIANLIGHLLAKGNRILVTAHTTKALRVLREQVVDALRPLCVSVLDDELASRRELEVAVSAIIERLSRSDRAQLGRERYDLTRQRAELVIKVRAAEQRVLEARATEYRQIVVAGEPFAPCQAARRLAERQREAGWIPGAIASGEPLPLSEAELSDLYATNIEITAADELELSGVLPELSALPSPAEFDAFVHKRLDLHSMPRHVRKDLWDREAGEPAQFEQLAQQLTAARELLPTSEPWRRAAALAAFTGGHAVAPWNELSLKIEELASAAQRTLSARLQYGPTIAEENISDGTAETLYQILGHFERGGHLSGMKLLFNPAWRSVIRAARVDGQEPSQEEHFRVLIDAVELVQRRRALQARWDRQVAALGGPPAAALGEEIESTARQYVQILREVMSSGRLLAEALERAQKLGFAWDRVLAAEEPCRGPNGEIDRVVAAVERCVLDQLVRRANALRWAAVEAEARRMQAPISDYAANHPSSSLLTEIERAAHTLDPNRYRRAYERIASVLAKRPRRSQRQALSARLAAAAPDWASAIEHRDAAHGEGVAPGDPREAWLHAQLADEIARRHRSSLEAAQAELEQARMDLRRVTAELSDTAAWEAQLQRTSLAEQQALIGWLDTVKRIGKGTGKRAGALRAEAQRLMTRAAEAVPVWVMPLSRVVHSFDPARAPFDVVIIDEASQMDVLGLIAIYLGKKVVVVGDHEQVSPLAVGQDLDETTKLIAEHLTGIPNAHLYDGRQSVYDLARQSFGGTIRLVEHFRCVPQIIEFSNWLSYGGEIKPLREAADSKLLPHVIAHHVENLGVHGHVNHNEALEIAALIVAASEEPAYDGKSFGVVSLVGDEQAELIDSELRRRLSPEEHAKRRLVCGNSAQFQGDERDVMWLSVVDVATDGPLRLRSDQTFQQRYNVAASRARDQMWVVYSLDPFTDLKPEDLRRKLIEHALDPDARSRERQLDDEHVESELEKQVLERLRARGFNVRPQWQVGHYQIDLVVESSGKRLAIECDGDRHHSMDNLQQELARQATLERLGWRFVRVRGTLFYLDPEAALAPVFAALEAQGIAATPLPAVSPSDLRNHLVSRAQEIRRAWETAES